MRMPKLKVITGQKEYQRALKAVDALWDAKPGSAAHDALEVLALLLEDYEKRTFHMEEPDPVAAIRFRLEQAGMEQKDLVSILGSVPRSPGGSPRLLVSSTRRAHRASEIAGDFAQGLSGCAARRASCTGGARQAAAGR